MGGVINIFRRKFFVSICRKLSPGYPSVLCFRMFPGANNSMDNKGVIKIFRRNFYGSLCRKLSQGNSSVFCFRKHPVAKKIMDNRGVSRFSVGKFLS